MNKLLFSVIIFSVGFSSLAVAQNTNSNTTESTNTVVNETKDKKTNLIKVQKKSVHSKSNETNTIYIFNTTTPKNNSGLPLHNNKVMPKTKGAKPNYKRLKKKTDSIH